VIKWSNVLIVERKLLYLSNANFVENISVQIIDYPKIMSVLGLRDTKKKENCILKDGFMNRSDMSQRQRRKKLLKLTRDL